MMLIDSHRALANERTVKREVNCKESTEQQQLIRGSVANRLKYKFVFSGEHTILAN